MTPKEKAAAYRVKRKADPVFLKKERARHRELKRLKYAADPEYRAKVKARRAAWMKSGSVAAVNCNAALRLRGRLGDALKGKLKLGSAVKLLGCELDEFVSYIEAKFKPGMSWNERSSFHIDHIRPLASFDLSDPIQLAAACHYTNLQPLTPAENLLKAASWAA